MGNFVEIEFQNKTTLVRLADIRMLELAEEDDVVTLIIFVSNEDSVRVEADSANAKMVQNLYRELKAKLEAL